MTGRAAAVLACACACACGSGSGTADAGAEAGGGDAGPMVKMSGTVISYAAMAPLPMATVSVYGGPSAVTDAMGVFSLVVPKGTPLSFSVTADNYTKLIEEETTLSGDVKRDETLVDRNTQGSLSAFLPGLDKAKAALVVGLTKKTTCASSEGAIVDLDPPQPNAVRRYFQGGLPSAMRTYAADDQRVMFYNLEPGAKVRPALSWAPQDDAGAGPAKPCKMVAYPATDPDQAALVYTGNVTLESGEAFSYERLLLE